MEKLLTLIQTLLTNRSLIQIVLSDKRKKAQECNKIVFRPILLDGEVCFQAEQFIGTKVTHQNFSDDNTSDIPCYIENHLNSNFKQVTIFSTEADYQVLANKPDNLKIIKKPPTKQPQVLSHNRTKQYIIPDGIPCDFLVHLGVMSKDGKVLKAHYGKFRQINRFLEIVDDVVDALPKDDNKPLRIIDFGCGKAYLTFALYHYLHVIHHYNIEVLGLDLKKDVISFCSEVAKALHYDNLSFMMGDIADYTLSDSSHTVDMVVTLHACDTATDYALINAVKWNASVILSVPCCQHEINGQIKNSLHDAMFKHGILKERFSALLTDSLRTLKLESVGYDISMIEFTSLEHTAKNIMIRAVKTKKAKTKALAEYNALKEYWNVNPTIEKM